MMKRRFLIFPLYLKQQHVAKPGTDRLCRSTQAHRFLSLGLDKSYRYSSPGLVGVPLRRRKMFSSTQKQQCAHFSDLRKHPGNVNHLQVEVISTGYIKPAVPTPKHLRTYTVSILDQMVPHFYSPFVFFFPNDDQNNSKVINIDDLTLKRRLLLKQSLSETLTILYPLAGKVMDSRHIDCNEEGVYCVDAKVSHSLSDFLSQPGNKYVRPLLPFGSNVMELFLKTCVVMIQITSFSCGGISIGLYASHKIIDGYSYATFLKAWAATARGCPLDVSPTFTAQSIFPSSPTLLESELTVDVLPLFLEQVKRTTKRFVFPTSSLNELKRRCSSSRAMVVTALIWKCTIKALEVGSADNDRIKKTLALTQPVNLRERSSPPMPLYSMGNIVWSSYVTLCHEDDYGLESLVQNLKKSIEKLDCQFVEALRGDEGPGKVREYLNTIKTFYFDKNIDHILISSMCNGGLYDVNFGWGKPTWVSYVNTDYEDANIPVLTNSVLLMDMRCGNGIEAWVTLRNEEMAVFERDPELLEMASVNPSPLD